MKTVLVLLDSLRRDYLKAYNELTSAMTPHMDAFCRDSVLFENHYLGSAPCMPARRDLFTGRLNFLERGWGGIEPYDVSFPSILKKNRITTYMATDHTHYVELGGENYLQQFCGWDIIRGQEDDVWAAQCKKPEPGDEYFGRISMQYEMNRARFLKEEDYPTPKTFQTACRWVEENAGADDFFLMVEGFDPHEPFDCPDKYRAMYDDSYTGPRYDWIQYGYSEDSPEAKKHIRNCYQATLTMADTWFGKFMDTLKKYDMYEDTMIIFTTDHGLLLGEHGMNGKNRMHHYNELCRLPLAVHLPGGRHAGERRQGITQNIDMMPTILEFYGLEIPASVRGKSLWGMLEGREEKVRDACIFGLHGGSMSYADAEYTYYRAPNLQIPLYHYAAIPTTLWNVLGVGLEDKMEMGAFLKGTNYPVYKIPAENSPYYVELLQRHELYDNRNDSEQRNPLSQEETEREIMRKIGKLLDYYDSPDEIYDRFGIERS